MLYPDNGFCSYFVAYSLSQGMDPDEMNHLLKNNIPYIAWNQDRWKEFKRIRGIPETDPGIHRAQDFEHWLFTQYLPAKLLSSFPEHIYF